MNKFKREKVKEILREYIQQDEKLEEVVGQVVDIINPNFLEIYHQGLVLLEMQQAELEMLRLAAIYDKNLNKTETLIQVREQEMYVSKLQQTIKNYMNNLSGIKFISSDVEFQVFRLAVFEKKTNKEVAKILHLSQGYVANLKVGILKKLKDLEDDSE